MTVQELIDELEKVKDKTWNVFIPVRGKVIQDVVAKVEEDYGYYEKLIILKTIQDV